MERLGNVSQKIDLLHWYRSSLTTAISIALRSSKLGGVSPKMISSAMDLRKCAWDDTRPYREFGSNFSSNNMLRVLVISSSPSLERETPLSLPNSADFSSSTIAVVSILVDLVIGI